MYSNKTRSFLFVLLVAISLDCRHSSISENTELPRQTANITTLDQSEMEMWTRRVVGNVVDPNASRVFFLDGETGWVYDGRDLLFTSNGGLKWSRKTMPISADLARVEIAFKNADVGWLAATVEGPGENENDLRLMLFRTDDGGASWTEIQTGASVLAQGIRRVGKNFWLFGRKSTFDGYADEPLVLVLEADSKSARDLSGPINSANIDPNPKNEQKPSWSEFVGQPSGCILARNSVGMFFRSCNQGDSWSLIRKTGIPMSPYTDPGWHVSMKYGFFWRPDTVEDKGVTIVHFPIDETLKRTREVILPKYSPSFGFVLNSGELVILAEKTPLAVFDNRTTDVLVSKPDGTAWTLIESLGDLAYEAAIPSNGDQCLWIISRDGTINRLTKK